MSIYVLCLFVSAKRSTKIQKVLLNSKNICRKILILKLFSVISQSETKKHHKNNV